MSVVLNFDGENRRIYLKQGVESFHPIDDVYREYVEERRLNEEFRKYYPFIVASFTTFKYNKNGVDYYTPRYIQLLDGAKIIPYDELSIVDVTGEIFTDDGTDPIRLDTLVNGVKINYKPPEAELIKVETGISGLTIEESDKLMSLGNATVDVGELTTAIWTAETRTLTESSGLTENDLHVGLDNYTNKSDWMDITDLSPILTALADLNNLSITDIDGSAILAKKSQLESIVISIADIPTTNDVADLTPVLTAISNLTDVTPIQIRDAFNDADFKDKNTEAEIHLWLDSYTKKDDWKSNSVDLTSVLDAITALNNISVSDIDSSTVLVKLSHIESLALLIAEIPTTDNVADLTPVLTAISNLNNVTPAEVRAAFNATDFKDKNTETEIHTWLDTYVNKGDWSQSADLTALEAKIDAQKIVIDNIYDSARGGWKVENNQMIFLRWDGTELFRFDLQDADGNPDSLLVRRMVAVKP